MRRFDERVLTLMANNIDVPLVLSNLAARAQISAAHIHITRHLDLEGTRLTDLAQKAGMSKQAMGDLVDQCEAWDLVTREPDPRDARARMVRFRPPGCCGYRPSRTRWRRRARFRRVGQDVATVVKVGWRRTPARAGVINRPGAPAEAPQTGDKHADPHRGDDQVLADGLLRSLRFRRRGTTWPAAPRPMRPS